ncbi:MAG: glutamate synthase subunit beta, partial [Sedimentisphaerales bacterium]|nr:glutamate synthase subunit beta [Sedimentisphaerales bacterium]
MMGKPGGFLEHNRKEVTHRPVGDRVGDFKEIDLPHSQELLVEQAARCMECGIPFCHGIGCPVQNRIPEFNDLVYRGRWREACDNLHSTNNFPEITGRTCPAPCETSCTLSINDEPVLIRHIEFQIVERGFERGWILPKPATKLSGKRVAIVGSGPAGLAAAQQLTRAGHDVTVFEKEDRIGGLLRYGIPDFKLDKAIIERRLKQLFAEGVHFQTNVLVGEDVSVRYLRGRFDAVCLTMGAGQPRDLKVPGRDCSGVVFAMDY